MTDIVIRPRADEKYDIYVIADNGEPLLNSSQGYSRAADAEDVVRMLFGGGASPVPTPLHDYAEPLKLTVEYRDGRVKSEVLR